MKAASLLAALGLSRNADGDGTLAASRDERAWALREKLVATVAREVRDRRVLSVLQSTPRHVFVPGVSLEEAYTDHPLPIGHGATISQPTVVGLMSEALELQGNERVLEVGTGSGYQAAVLCKLAGEVDTVEVVRELCDAAASLLADLGCTNVRVHCGDGWNGLAERAPFDRIVVTAAPDVVPRALVEQLAEGGLLVIPVGPASGEQRLECFRKVEGSLKAQDLGAVRFVPMVHAS